jgi:hypothetical protein
MTRWWPGLAAAAVIACGLSSCGTGGAQAVHDVRDLPPAELMARTRARDARIVTMTGKGSVAFEGPDAAGSAYFVMSLRKPDSLLVSLEGPFGINAGFFFLSRQKFVMYSSIENRAVMGAPAQSALRGVIPVDLTVDQIMDAFTGGFPLPDESPAGYVIDDGNIRADYVVRGEAHTYWVDPATGLVVRSEVRNAGGDLLLETSSSRITELNGVPAPGRVTVSFPARGQRLSIHYTSLEINEGNPSFSYAVPRNARITIR